MNAEELTNKYGLPDTQLQPSLHSLEDLDQILVDEAETYGVSTEILQSWLSAINDGTAYISGDIYHEFREELTDLGHVVIYDTDYIGVWHKDRLGENRKRVMYVSILDNGTGPIISFVRYNETEDRFENQYKFRPKAFNYFNKITHKGDYYTRIGYDQSYGLTAFIFAT